jgi:hypothetical protein
MSSALKVLVASYGLVFLGAALSKLDSWATWKVTVASFMRHGVLAAIIRIGLPAVELCAAVMLVLSPILGLTIAAVIMAVLALGVFVLRFRHSGQQCNCFGALMPSEIGPRLAARNALLAGVAAGGAVVARGERPASLTAIELVLVLFVGIMILLTSEFRRVRRVVGFSTE